MRAEIKPMAVSFADAARIAALSERTLRRAAADGRLTMVRTGRATRVLLVDLEQFLGDHRQGRLADHDRRQRERAAAVEGARAQPDRQ
jgi:excisionase family DNA binding protein